MAQQADPSARPTTTAYDDLGAALPPGPRRRVVSLVPSLTEAIALTCPDRLVGATDWCTRPAGLAVPRVRGTKNPNLRAIADLAPDLVIANQEENRELDVRRLRERGMAVWVSRIETLDQAFASLRRLFRDALALDPPAWLSEAEALWTSPVTDKGTVAVPIWRDPWMVVGEPTFTSDLLRRAGWINVYDDHEAARYPTVDVAQIESKGPDLVMLPDEPYVFTDADGPEAFTLPTRLVSGRLLTWYGPSLCEAARVLR